MFLKTAFIAFFLSILSSKSFSSTQEDFQETHIQRSYSFDVTNTTSQNLVMFIASFRQKSETSSYELIIPVQEKARNLASDRLLVPDNLKDHSCPNCPIEYNFSDFSKPTGLVVYLIDPLTKEYSHIFLREEKGTRSSKILVQFTIKKAKTPSFLDENFFEKIKSFPCTLPISNSIELPYEKLLTLTKSILLKHYEKRTPIDSINN